MLPNHFLSGSILCGFVGCWFIFSLGYTNAKGGGEVNLARGPAPMADACACARWRGRSLGAAQSGAGRVRGSPGLHVWLVFVEVEELDCLLGSIERILVGLWVILDLSVWVGGGIALIFSVGAELFEFGIHFLLELLALAAFLVRHFGGGRVMRTRYAIFARFFTV